jgi:hypothetical protein
VNVDLQGHVDLGSGAGDLWALEGEPTRWESVQQPDPGSEQDRSDVKAQLVDDPGGDRLLRGGRAAHHDDGLVAGCRASLRRGGVDAVGDERERGRPTVDGLVGAGGEDEAFGPERAVRAQVPIPTSNVMRPRMKAPVPSIIAAAARVSIGSVDWCQA